LFALLAVFSLVFSHSVAVTVDFVAATGDGVDSVVSSDTGDKVAVDFVAGVFLLTSSELTV